jgi:hypothetical protein
MLRRVWWYARFQLTATTGALQDQDKSALIEHARWYRRGCMLARRAMVVGPSRQRRRSATGPESAAALLAAAVNPSR